MSEEQKKKSLNEFIADEVKRDPAYFAAKLVDAAREADPTALKQVTQALEAVKYSEDESLKLNNEQLTHIICLAADRIRAAADAKSAV